MVKVRHDEGVANRIGPEPCVGASESVSEASAGERTGQPLSRESYISGVPTALSIQKAKRAGASSRVVDRDGRALVLDPQPADLQDRDGAVPVLKQLRRSYPFIAKALAVAGYAGDKPDSATLIAVEIVRKLPGYVGFVVHPGDGWLNASSLGSAVIGGSGMIRRPPSLLPGLSYTPLPS